MPVPATPVRILKTVVWLSLLMLMGISQSEAAPVDIEADSITRTGDGVVVARGDVIIKREHETLSADEVRYRSEEMVLSAKGHVVIKSEKATITADEAVVHAGSKTGNMTHAVIVLPNGERVSAEKLRRIDDQTFEADEAYFSSCPINEESWRLAASHARIDQQQGILNAENARFELWQVPVLYSPWWQQPLRRKSGLLLPNAGFGKRRGTEVAVPLYFAPAENFDATVTPHWMSARGVMAESELRHVSSLGSEQLAADGVRDAVTNRLRSRLQGELHWHLPAELSLDGAADHVSDPDYLADFGSDDAISSRYLSSDIALSQALSDERFESLWFLQARHQQNLLAANNSTTLQVLPRLQSAMSWAAAPNIQLHLDQQSTRFDRRVGVNGWRVDVKPYLELPWELAGGGIEATVTAGVRHSRYWLGQTVVADRRPTRNSVEISAEVRSDLERISENGSWRHVLSPILRYDYIDAPDQTAMPNFDSTWSRLTWSNLLSGNRFSGYDRIERSNRFAAVLENRLQFKDGAGDLPREVLAVRGGVAYDLLRQSVDTGLQPAQTKPFSNLLGELVVRPTPWLTFSSSGQYDPSQRYWAVLSAAVAMSWGKGNGLRIGYRSTDARYFRDAQLLTVNADAHLFNRWVANADWQYDLLLRLSQRTDLGLRYEHPCWTLGGQAYRINRRTGTSTASNFGFRLVAEFKGLGNQGS